MKPVLFSFFLLAAVLLAGCCGVDKESQSKAEALFEENLYEKHKGKTTEFYGRYGLIDDNRRYQLEPSVENRQKLLDNLAMAYDKLAAAEKRGPVSKETVKIPRFSAAPSVDGVIGQSEWNGVFHARGEYPMDGIEKCGEDRIDWYMGWYGDKLYVAAHVKDKAVFTLPGTCAEQGFPKWNRIYLADCVEFFIRPTMKTEHYYEFLINADGNTQTSDHVMQDVGFWRTINRIRPSTAVGRAVRTPDGFSIEWQIPLLEFVEKYLPGRYPEPGDTFTFSMVHINASSAPDYQAKRFTLCPLLWEGHNIFDYTSAVLAE